MIVCFFIHETILVYKFETFKNCQEVKHIIIMMIPIIYFFKELCKQWNQPVLRPGIILIKLFRNLPLKQLTSILQCTCLLFEIIISRNVFVSTLRGTMSQFLHEFLEISRSMYCVYVSCHILSSIQ